MGFGDVQMNGIRAESGNLQMRMEISHFSDVTCRISNAKQITVMWN